MKTIKVTLTSFIWALSANVIAQEQVSLTPASNAPSWSPIGVVVYKGKGEAHGRNEVTIYVDTAIKGSTTQPFPARLLLGKSKSGSYLIVDNSPLTRTVSMRMDLAVDCKAEAVKQIRAVAFSREMATGQSLGTVGEDLFSNFTLQNSNVQDVRDAKQLAIKYYCQRAATQEKTERDDDARRRFLETPEGKKQLADEAAKAKKAEGDRIKAEAAEKARIAKEFPFYAVISCGVGTGHMTINACFSGDYGSLEIRNGSEYGLYKIVQIANGLVPNAREQREGFIVNLRKRFEIDAENGGGKNIIMGLTIVDRSTGKVIYQKQTDRFGSLRFKN